MKKLILFVLAAVFAVSCTTRLTDFTVISTKNVDLSNLSKFKKGAQRVEGQSIAYIIIIIPTGIPNMKEAIDKAIESTKGAVALADGVLYAKNMWFVLGGMNGYIVEGTPLIDPSVAENGSYPERQICELNADGSVKSMKTVSKEEYDQVKNDLIGK